MTPTIGLTVFFPVKAETFILQWEDFNDLVFIVELQESPPTLQQAIANTQGEEQGELGESLEAKAA